MKKYIRLVSAVLMLVMVCTTSAFAASPTSSIEQSQDLILVQGEPIGSRADEDGFLLEDTDIRSARSSGLPFSMTANNVSKLLTTYSAPGKNFTGGAFDGLVGEGLLITGKVTDTSGSDVKVGACSYNANKDTFYTVMPIYQLDSENSKWVFVHGKFDDVLWTHYKRKRIGHCFWNIEFFCFKKSV